MPVGSVEGADAVICSGHTAVVLGAITHRKPLLCIPTSADAEESAARVSRCGLGAKIDHQAELHPESLARFFEQVDRGDFAPGRTRLQVYKEDWRHREASLGDIGLSLGEGRRDEAVPLPTAQRCESEPG